MPSMNCTTRFITARFLNGKLLNLFILFHFWGQKSNKNERRKFYRFIVLVCLLKRTVVVGNVHSSLRLSPSTLKASFAVANHHFVLQVLVKPQRKNRK